MSNIEDRLWQKQKTEPKRTLTPDFTQQAMERIQQTADNSLRGRLASSIERIRSMKFPLTQLKHAGVLGIIAGVVMTGGIGYAGARWLGFDDGQSYGGVTTLDNGDTRFWITGEGEARCEGGKEKKYFIIREGSSIKPADVADMVAGTCEFTDLISLFPEIQLQGTYPKGLDPKSSDNYEKAMASTEVNDQFYITGGTIKTIGPDSITVEIPLPGERLTRTIPTRMDVKTYDRGERIALRQLKSGDAVQLILHTRATYADISKLSSKYNLPEGQVLPNSTVYGVAKLHHKVYDRYAEGRDFTRMIPKSNDADWRKVENLKPEHRW